MNGRIVFPRFGLGADLAFLVDTGSDRTMLMPGDGLMLGLDYALLNGAAGIGRGVGGAVVTYTEPAWIVFSDGEQLFGYSINLAILEYSAEMLGVPSILGRDLLHRWHLDYAFEHGQLTAEVLSADVAVSSSEKIAPRFVHE